MSQNIYLNIWMKHYHIHNIPNFVSICFSQMVLSSNQKVSKSISNTLPRLPYIVSPPLGSSRPSILEEVLEILERLHRLWATHLAFHASGYLFMISSTLTPDLYSIPLHLHVFKLNQSSEWITHNNTTTLACGLGTMNYLNSPWHSVPTFTQILLSHLKAITQVNTLLCSLNVTY